MTRYPLSPKQAAAVAAAKDAAHQVLAAKERRDDLMREAVQDYGVSVLRLTDELAMKGLARESVARITRR